MSCCKVCCTSLISARLTMLSVTEVLMLIQGLSTHAFSYCPLSWPLAAVQTLSRCTKHLL